MRWDRGDWLTAAALVAVLAALLVALYFSIAHSGGGVGVQISCPGGMTVQVHPDGGKTIICGERKT